MELFKAIVKICGRILGLWYGYDEPIAKPADLEDDSENDLTNP